MSYHGTVTVTKASGDVLRPSFSDTTIAGHSGQPKVPETYVSFHLDNVVDLLSFRILFLPLIS